MRTREDRGQTEAGLELHDRSNELINAPPGSTNFTSRSVVEVLNYFQLDTLCKVSEEEVAAKVNTGFATFVADMKIKHKTRWKAYQEFVVDGKVFDAYLEYQVTMNKTPNLTPAIFNGLCTEYGISSDVLEILGDAGKDEVLDQVKMTIIEPVNFQANITRFKRINEFRNSSDSQISRYMSESFINKLIDRLASKKKSGKRGPDRQKVIDPQAKARRDKFEDDSRKNAAEQALKLVEILEVGQNVLDESAALTVLDTVSSEQSLQAHNVVDRIEISITNTSNVTRNDFHILHDNLLEARKLILQLCCNDSWTVRYRDFLSGSQVENIPIAVGAKRGRKSKGKISETTIIGEVSRSNNSVRGQLHYYINRLVLLQDKLFKMQHEREREDEVDNGDIDENVDNNEDLVDAIDSDLHNNNDGSDDDEALYASLALDSEITKAEKNLIDLYKKRCKEKEKVGKMRPPNISPYIGFVGLGDISTKSMQFLSVSEGLSEKQIADVKFASEVVLH